MLPLLSGFLNCDIIGKMTIPMLNVFKQFSLMVMNILETL